MKDRYAIRWPRRFANWLGLFALSLTCLAHAAKAVVPSDMVLIPAGSFFMGSDEVDANQQRANEFGVGKPLYLDEHPRHVVDLGAFYIDRDEVTFARYRDFIISANYQVPSAFADSGYLLSQRILGFASDEKLRELALDTFAVDRDTRQMTRKELLQAIEVQRGRLDKLPISRVTWQDATAYCHWAEKRLPTEAEWEKAARGGDGRIYPWGNDWSPERANTGVTISDEEPGIRPVGSFPAGTSPYGVNDMAGNVMEWVSDWYRPYPGNDYASKDFGERFRVVRGGSWGGIGHYAISHFYRTNYRFYLRPDAAYGDLGFRCAHDVADSLVSNVGLTE